MGGQGVLHGSTTYHSQVRPFPGPTGLPYIRRQVLPTPSKSMLSSSRQNIFRSTRPSARLSNRFSHRRAIRHWLTLAFITIVSSFALLARGPARGLQSASVAVGPKWLEDAGRLRSRSAMRPSASGSPRRVARTPPAWMRPRKEFARSGSPEYMAARATYELAHRGVWDSYMAAVASNPSHSNYTNCAGRTALSYAASDNKREVVAFLVALPQFEMANEPDENGWTALHHAARAGGAEAMHALLSSDRFTEVFARDLDGRRAIDLLRRVSSVDRQQVAALLQRARSPVRVLYQV